jgi:uncharacterized protein YwgA
MRHAIKHGRIIAISSTDKSYYRGKYIDSDQQTRGCLIDLTVMLNSLEQAKDMLAEIKAVEQLYENEMVEINKLQRAARSKRQKAIDEIVKKVSA